MNKTDVLSKNKQFFHCLLYHSVFNTYIHLKACLAFNEVFVSGYTVGRGHLHSMYDIFQCRSKVFSIAYRYQAYGLDDYHGRCSAQPSGRSGRWCRLLPVYLQRIRNVHCRVSATRFPMKSVGIKFDRAPVSIFKG